MQKHCDRCLLRTVGAGQSEPTGISERGALKETYFACFQVPNFIWVTAWIGLHALMLKKHYITPLSEAVCIDSLLTTREQLW